MLGFLNLFTVFKGFRGTTGNNQADSKHYICFQFHYYNYTEVHQIPYTSIQWRQSSVSIDASDVITQYVQTVTQQMIAPYRSQK